MKSLIKNIALIAALLTSFTVPAAPPAAPQNLEQAWLVTESLLLWDAVPDATGYNVYRADDTNTAWVLVGSSAVPRFRDPAWQFLPSLYFITATNADGESAGSNPGAVVFAGPFTVSVDEPQSWSGTLSPTNAVLGLATSDPNGGQGLVDWGLAATNFTGFLLNTNYLPYQSFTLTNLTPRTIYFYRLTSVTSNRVGVNYLGSFATPDTNQPPVANNESWSLPEEWTIDFQLSGSDVDGDGLTFVLLTPSAHGSLWIIPTTYPWFSPPGHGQYNGHINYVGPDSFTYAWHDGLTLSAPATVTFNVTPMNDRPVANNQSVTTAEDTAAAVTLTGSDVDGDALTFSLVTSPQHGALTGTAPNLIYTPTADYYGSDTFQFRVSDGLLNATGVVSIGFARERPPSGQRPERDHR